jgi:hypothetical protein
MTLFHVTLLDGPKSLTLAPAPSTAKTALLLDTAASIRLWSARLNWKRLDQVLVYLTS